MASAHRFGAGNICREIQKASFGEGREWEANTGRKYGRTKERKVRKEEQRKRKGKKKVNRRK